MRSVSGVGRLVGQISTVALSLGLSVQACAATVQVIVQDGAGKPLPGAVAFLESPEAKRLVRPLAGAEIVQQKLRFNPDVLVVPAGTAVRFPNHDTVRHHVYSFSPAKKFELKLYAGVPANPVLFDQPGVVVLGCNIHDQMVGWVLVMETPYYVQGTAPDGSLRLDNVPAGSYQLRVWHETLPVGVGAHAQALTVSEPGGAPVVVRLGAVKP
jgi:plastocyanin